MAFLLHLSSYRRSAFVWCRLADKSIDEEGALALNPTHNYLTLLSPRLALVSSAWPQSPAKTAILKICTDLAELFHNRSLRTGERSPNQ